MCVGASLPCLRVSHTFAHAHKCQQSRTSNKHSILGSVVRFSLVKVLVWLGVVIKVKRQESAAKRLRIRDCVWRASGCQPAGLCQGRRGTTTGIPTDRLTCVPQTHPPPAAVIPDQSCFLPSCCFSLECRSAWNFSVWSAEHAFTLDSAGFYLICCAV